jgi:hypothetical protein
VPAPLVAVIIAGVPWLLGWAAGYITTDPPLTHVIEGTGIVVEHETGNGGGHRA